VPPKTPPDEFPLSSKRTIRGSRSLAREKVLQILAAIVNVDVDFDVVFPHVFFRQFTFDAGESDGSQRILRADEVHELEADVPIAWTQPDIDFAAELIRQTRVRYDYLQKVTEEHAKHWALERIAYIDSILLAMALAELISFPEIPPKVTIFEAIELAKKYSTDKSGTFINGILDAAYKALREKGEVNKTGTGLVT